MKLISEEPRSYRGSASFRSSGYFPAFGQHGRQSSLTRNGSSFPEAGRGRKYRAPGSNSTHMAVVMFAAGSALASDRCG